MYIYIYIGRMCCETTCARAQQKLSTHVYFHNLENKTRWLKRLGAVLTHRASEGMPRHTQRQTH